MIRDAAYAMSTEQTLVAAPVFPATSQNGYLSTNYVDVDDIGASGGREQYIEVEFTETCDAAVAIALAVWPDLGPAFVPDPSLVFLAGHKFISQHSLLVGDVVKGNRFYLPIRAASDQMPPAFVWRYMNVFFLVAGATVGAASVRLVDAITHNPRAFDAQNET